MNKKIENYDVVIIGGGSAGLTAAIYCGRAKLKTLVIEKSLVGGLATYTDEIANYPGFPDGIKGGELMRLFQKQAKNFGVDFKLTDVKSVDLKGNEKKVETFRTTYVAKVVIVATGSVPRLTGALNEEDFMYNGIAFCATCDAAANTGKTVMVIGSGDAAIEEGMFLTKFADKVIVSVMHDEGKMDCNEVSKAAALSNPKMSFVWNTMVHSFQGDTKLNKVVLRNLKTGDLQPIDVDSCFLFIGYLPDTKIFEGQLNMSKPGYIITNFEMETNIEGVFSAGDVRDKMLKQIATAVGDGALAGVGAEKYIAESETFEHQILNEGKASVAFLYQATDAKSQELLPIIETFTQEFLGKINVAKVDTYKSHGIAKKLEISVYPSVAFIKDRKVVKVVCDKIDLEILKQTAKDLYKI